MSADYIPRLRQELLRAAATAPAHRRRARTVRALRPLAAAAAVALVALAVVLALPVDRGDERPVDTAQTTYRVAGPVSERTAAILRERLAAAGIQDASVSVAAGGGLSIAAPDGARADLAALMRPGRLAIYDWERSVLGPRGEPAPADEGVTGGADAGQSAALTRAEAEARAARVPGGRAVRAPGGWFALGGEPALTNADVARARPARDPMLQEPIVAIDLTAAGQDAFSTLTRELAHRGRKQAADGALAPEARQHLAFVLDGRLVAVPFIDPQAAPDGIDGAVGTQIGGGLTPETARRTAALLSAGPLPAGLTPTEG